MDGFCAEAGKGLKTVFIGEILCLLGFIPVLGTIAALVGLILTLVGLNTAGRGDSGYQTAFKIAIINLVVGFGGGILSMFASGVGQLVNVVSSILGFLLVYFICTTTSCLLESRDGALAARGVTVWKLYAGCTVVLVVCSLVVLIPVLNVIAAAAAVVTAVVQIVAMVLYLIFLYKASDALQR